MALPNTPSSSPASTDVLLCAWVPGGNTPLAPPRGDLAYVAALLKLGIPPSSDCVPVLLSAWVPGGNTPLAPPRGDLAYVAARANTGSSAFFPLRAAAGRSAGCAWVPGSGWNALAPARGDLPHVAARLNAGPAAAAAAAAAAGCLSLRNGAPSTAWDPGGPCGRTPLLPPLGVLAYVAAR